jgi:hypothetical protein
MPTPRVFEFSFYEKTLPTLLARLTNSDGNPLLQADVSAIAVSFRSYDDPSAQHQTDAPVVANVIFDTLQTDAVWKEDAEGYNFKYTPAAGKFDQNDQYPYLVEVVCTLAAGGFVTAIWKANQLEVASTP